MCIFINIIFVFTSFFAYFRWRAWPLPLPLPLLCVLLPLLLLLLLLFCQIIVIECYSLNYSCKTQYRALFGHRDILKNNILNAFSFQTKNKLNQNKESERVRRTKTKQILFFSFFLNTFPHTEICKQYWNVVLSHFARKPMPGCISWPRILVLMYFCACLCHSSSLSFLFFFF